MTIAVAAKYPWGQLRQLLPSGINLPEAVIFVSDSRFSWHLSGKCVKTLDIGTKIFQLGNDVIGVYAGISRIGEVCFSELRYALSKQSNPNSVSNRKIAQEVFNRVYTHELAVLHLKKEESPLYILIGACSLQGNAELYRFSYSEAFSPISINGFDILGLPETANKFKELLSGELQKRVQEELSLRANYPQIPMAQFVPMPIQDGHVAMLMTAILKRVVESGADVTIGGQIQLSIVSMNGVSHPSISYSSNPDKPQGEWKEATADPNSLITITGIKGTFGLYHSEV